MDVSQYLDIFLDETKEHLQSLNTEILELEQDPNNMDTVNEIFRAAHSLKGMAGTMGYKRMQALTHDMENVFSEVRTGNIKVNGDMIDILFQCLDALEEYLKNIQTTADEGTNENASLIKRLNDVMNKESDVKPTVKESTSIAQPSVVESGKEWLKIVLDGTDQRVIGKAREQGKKVYGMTVKIQETCLLKAARAFLVYKAVEELGEIIISSPSAQDIEDEKFDLHFSLVIITDAQGEKLKAAVANVSEVESVLAEELDLSNMKIIEDSQDSQQHEEENNVTEEANHGVINTSVTDTSASGAKAPTSDTKQPVAKPVVNRTVRVDIEKLDVLMNLVSELIIAKNSLVAASGSQDGLTAGSGFNEQIEYLGSVTTNLHESVMKVRMVPIESVVNKFPRMIRDLSKKLDKKMELYMSGEETELDRTVVDEIGDPLMHLLRNAADHGLESTEVRMQRKKPAVGSIWLDAYQDGNNVIIEVRDDGNGIDVTAVKNKAIERGTITAEQANNMTDKEIMALLFMPSFSTSKTVTDVSGRGVGLDVVRSKIEALSGEVEVTSRLGEGSTWTIRLPLTLAIIQALMVVVGEEKYAIPLNAIRTIEDVLQEDIKLVQNKEVINLRGSVIPIIRLSKILDTPNYVDDQSSMVVVIIKKGDKVAGLVVNELLGQQEIVIKSMGKYIDNKCKMISGATILGDGEVALILDANAVI